MARISNRTQERAEFDEKLRRLFYAGLFLSATISGATFSFFYLSEGEYTLLDCLYMAVITVSTVGYAEAIPLATPQLKLLAILLIITGTGGMVYFASQVTALILEGDLNQWILRRRVQNIIDKLEDHVILCGAGATGRYAANELSMTDERFVLVDQNASKFGRFEGAAFRELLFVEGDAAEDDVLVTAGIERAKALICALPSDRDNLFVVVSARKLNPNLHIVSRVVEQSATTKLIRAGADEVVSPNQIGGRRLAQQVSQPEVSSFLEAGINGSEEGIRIAELHVHSESPYLDRPIGVTDIRSRYNVLVVGLRYSEEDQARYAPGPDAVLRAGCVLIVCGPGDDVERFVKAHRQTH